MPAARPVDLSPKPGMPAAGFVKQRLPAPGQVPGDETRRIGVQVRPDFADQGVHLSWQAFIA